MALAVSSAFDILRLGGTPLLITCSAHAFRTKYSRSVPVPFLMPFPWFSNYGYTIDTCIML
eukprot:m.311715 g.311715  ORF g.311715 m.311715 type:complete len:61 (+) comp127257_c0_seq1:820-1002(+)